MDFSSLLQALRKKIKFYYFYNHRLLFLFGLMFSCFLTDNAILSVLMLYFTSNDGGLIRSTLISTFQEALSSLLALLMGHLADSYVGRFRTVLFTTTAYIGGLMLLCVFNPYDITWLVMVALVLVAMGASGVFLLQYILLDLIHRNDKSGDRCENRSTARIEVWWNIVKVLAAVTSTLWVTPTAVLDPNSSWGKSFLICLILMTSCLIVFCMGHKVYHQRALTERPVHIFCHAIFDCIRPDSKIQNSSNISRQGRSPQHSRNILQEDWAVIKRLFGIFPMWATFFVVASISATGNTFFIEQYSNLNTDKFPSNLYSLIQSFSGAGIVILYGFTHFCNNEKVEIGVGMICSILSCIFAWQLEVHRLKDIKKLEYEDGLTSISFLWLVPQFCMLGFMEGLTTDGLIRFFRSRVDEPMKRYGEEYIEFILGLGKLVNMFLILILKSWGWFEDTINDSRLDKYYVLLACICSVNFLVYCCVVQLCYKDKKEVLRSSDHDDSSQRDKRKIYQRFTTM